MDEFVELASSFVVVPVIRLLAFLEVEIQGSPINSRSPTRKFFETGFFRIEVQAILLARECFVDSNLELIGINQNGWEYKI